MIDRRERFEHWLNHFKSTDDTESKIWDFPEHNNTSDFLVGNKNFRSGDSPWWITLIDSYKGRKPVLWSREFFIKGFIPTYMIPTLLLDSQVMNELHKYVTDYEALELSKRESIRAFLTFFQDNNCDISPIFYNLEAMDKSDPNRREVYVRERLKTIFSIQTMNAEEFRDTGNVAPDPSAQQEQLDFQKAHSLEGYLSQQVRILFDAYHNSKVHMIANASYAFLVKMALVHKQKSSVVQKNKAMREFLENTIGLMAGPEQFLAVCYFANPNRYQRFVPPLQSGMNMTKFKRKLRASSWDMVLVRLPSILGNAGTPHLSDSDVRFSLSYVCTAEIAIRDVMEPQIIETIFDLKEELGGRSTLLGFDVQRIERVIGKDTLHAMMDDDHQFLAQRMEKRKKNGE